MDNKIKELQTIFTSEFHVISHTERIGRNTIVAQNDNGLVIYATYNPKFDGKINVDIFKVKENENED